ncbi:hypothetical protein sscle_02g019210 [Sclerotinia sclerotiorum 1980 UF-70]|uniref:Uncharacterized protein n=1 Tax=Sclerotinia sclerotiorum (strain ATCC 18683 / 1980 / Ss-1) TaxID=665079 RepID=A0A1D9PWT0_SCLS1|nr:hypothetical protein sscle_02g019210 [Sclerotinia sclerotiorum 1980 UF-70]
MAKLKIEYPEYDFAKVCIQTTDSIQGGSVDIILNDPVRTKSPGFTNDFGRNSIMFTCVTSFQIVTANSKDMQCVDSHTPIIIQAFDIARRSNSCIRITRGMEKHERLLSHRYVHTRMVGTGANFAAATQAPTDC